MFAEASKIGRSIATEKEEAAIKERIRWLLRGKPIKIQRRIE